MRPLVSIGIPCFNGAPSLKRAIDSALGQSWPELEVIVVDDSSTDSSLLVAGAYGDRIMLRRAGHRGANQARNVILQEARGEWVQYLDADDYLEPEKIERQLAEADGGENADVLYSPVWIEEGGQRHPGEIDPKLDLPAQWLTWQLPQTGGALWRRAALEELTGWRRDQPCCQEHELYLRAIQAGLRFQFTPTPGAVYRIWSDQTLCRKDPRLVVRTKTKLIDAMHEWLVARKHWTPKHAALAGRACFEMARTLARENPSEAADYYRQRKRLGLIRLEGPAAPASYRLAQLAFGFRGAEALARRLRSC
jgi:cellulose synthase/poly-beta-1,6-N-acetylglucosamine synthase-like glycosyltransferase